MTKNVKMLLGVALVGGVGYYFWKKSQESAPKANFKNFKDGPCNCHTAVDTIDGENIYICGSGQHASKVPSTNGKCKGKR